MSRDSNYRLHAVTVVITAASHNPSMLNPDFLKTQRIVPSGWEVSESVSTPPVSMIMFANGIQWVMDESVLNVIERCDSGFQDGYAIHQTVIRYLETVTHVPYRNLGLKLERGDPFGRPAELAHGALPEGRPLVTSRFGPV